MLSLTTMTVVGVIVAAALVIYFLKVRQKDLLQAMIDKRRPSAKIVSRADYVEGAEQIPVALSLTENVMYYENPDLDASFDLDRLDEIEYSDELATGRAVHHGCRVLRLRSHGAAFEFVMDGGESQKWANLLPPRSYGRSTAQAE